MGAVVGTLGARTESGQPEKAVRHAVAQHLGLVYHVARGLARSGVAVELDELVSAGTLGLIDAIAHFDERRGLAFTTFAAPRIRGAMLDELRRLDHVPRSVRRQARAVAAATDALASELCAAPDEAQLAARLGIDLATLWRWQCDGEGTHHVPLEKARADGDGAFTGEEYLSASTGCEVDEALTQEQEMAALTGAIRALGSRQRAVLTLYYYEELRLHEIGEILGISESRVCQIRTQAIARLRDQLVSLRGAVGIPERTQAAASSSRRRASLSVGSLST